MIITFYYANYFYAFGIGGFTYPFPEISYMLIPLIMGLIGWFNITTHIQFGEKGKKIYNAVIILAPLCPILGIIGLLNPGFFISITIAIFFLASFLILLGYVIIGFFLKIKVWNVSIDSNSSGIFDILFSDKSRT